MNIKYVVILFLFPLTILAQESTKIAISEKNFGDIKFLKQDGNIYDISASGKNPYLFTSMFESALNKENTIFSFEYFCPAGIDFIRLTFFSEQKKTGNPIIIRDIGSTEGWVEFKTDIGENLDSWGSKGDYMRIDLGNNPDLKIQIRNLKLRPLTYDEKKINSTKAAKKKQDLILENHLKDYLSKDFPNQLKYVLVNNKKVEISGNVSNSENYFLAEISPYENITEIKSFEFITPLKIKNQKFQIKIDRKVKRHGFYQDRVLSKWVLLKKENKDYKIVSHARYADSIVPKYNYSFVKPSNKKGLGGFTANGKAPVSDLDDLGITSVTVNIWVNGLLRSKPSEENMPFKYMGKTYYVNKKEIEKYDQTMRSTASRNIEVSAILLVAKASDSKDKVIGKILQHPDTDPSGIYAMPNMVSPEGIQYYSAILDFLSDRYSRPDKKYGRIHNWIIHNEVDAGWVWTNAGEKTALTFMDLYHKSMRISYNIARKYNANSKVFISLTHYWNWTSNPHFYHSKELLEDLLKYSKAEGDFEWAIAQHPYPESLREPKTWLDKKVNYNFDTPLITFKNLEVLDAWVKQPEVLYRSKVKRTVYLSENGTNSPTYDEKDLKEQAAGLAYALKKIKNLDGIDGIQYHNWIDNRREGGLRIGLRKFADDKNDPSGPKPAWFVYKAFGTDKEDEIFDQYKGLIGINDWGNIMHKVSLQKKKVLKELNIQADTWVATDALGRSLPTYEECGPVKDNRYVGIFYFITHNNSNTSGPFNVTQILRDNVNNPKWGDGSHYWGEPEIGYYLNNEEWAIRKHAFQLVDAGVDVIIFDVTNDKTYFDTYITICNVFQKMRNEGNQTPQITFLGSEKSINILWKEFYSKNLYKNLWFIWKGKPLLLYGQHEIPSRNKMNDIKFSKEILDFFNLKQSWAWTSLPWYDNGQDEWPWIDHFPQAVSWHDDPTEKEMVPVSVAQHPLSNIGRSFHNFHQPKLNEYDITPWTGQGLYFQEQWDWALKVDPEFVFVTGWNEWSSGKRIMGKDIQAELLKWKFYPGAHLGKVGAELKEGDTYFIDEYNQEYSRDIEPMKGGHNDNYYYQLISNVRKYKGVNEPVKKTYLGIDFSRNFDQWNSVKSNYFDHIYDTTHRSSQKQGNAGPYINTKGRNDFVSAKVANDDKNVYFYISTRDTITSYKDNNWMLLLIDKDQNPSTGWNGYDLLVNETIISDSLTTIKTYSPEKGWVLSKTIPFKIDGKQLMLSIPKKLLETNNGLNFDFHWLDNPSKLNSIDDLIWAGDNAPSRRSNYRY
ncbi:DUF5722 domain-containing protein [Gaetbulibacter aestuarii]|uniref:DUF5722 domain-containing protein n=1 Tax=Gaetbulibacter aestuarii TaxID=1502358 RepID=A0ABW7MXX7_9FLAO